MCCKSSALTSKQKALRYDISENALMSIYQSNGPMTGWRRGRNERHWNFRRKEGGKALAAFLLLFWS